MWLHWLRLRAQSIYENLIYIVFVCLYFPDADSARQTPHFSSERQACGPGRATPSKLEPRRPWPLAAAVAPGCGGAAATSAQHPRGPPFRCRSARMMGAPAPRPPPPGLCTEILDRPPCGPSAGEHGFYHCEVLARRVCVSMAHARLHPRA